MAIRSSGEFEIIVNTILMRVGQRLDVEPNNGPLIGAKKRMEQGMAWAVHHKKPSAAELQTFTDAAEVVRQTFRNDSELSDKLFDLLDFLEYGL